MIQKVNQLKRKSFQDYTGPDEEFKRKNIIFAYNGQGKSALALGIRDEFLKDDGKAPENIRIFNKDYINDNLLLRDAELETGRIKGIVANFGEKDIDIKKQIEDLTSSIMDTAPLEDEIQRLRASTRREIDAIHDRKKGKANIAKKDASYKLEDVVKLYTEDMKKALALEPDKNKLQRIEGDDSLDREVQKLERLIIPPVAIIPKTEHQAIKEIFSKNFSGDDIPSSEVVRWLNEGVSLHEKHAEGTCKFCGNTNINLNEIKRRVETYNAGKQERAMRGLIAYGKKLEDVLMGARSVYDKKEEVEAALGAIAEVAGFEELKSAIENLEKIKAAIAHKTEDIHFQGDFDVTMVTTTLEDIASYRSIIEKVIQDKLAESRIKANNMGKLVKGAIGAEILVSPIISSNLKIIEEKEAELSSTQARNKDAQKKITKLKQIKSNISDFADHVNSVLGDIGVTIRLDVCENDYTINSTLDNVPLTVNDISEGEKNLLALLFFYYELFQDKKQEQAKPEIEVIVVDDPISSMDDSNRFYVLELMKELLALPEPQQVFIMTHVWDDFCNLCYGKQDNDSAGEYRFFQVVKRKTGSRIERIPSQEKPYRHLFKEIKTLADMADDEVNGLDDCMIYHCPNSMRRVLEEFLAFKTPNHVIPTSKQQKYLENIFHITSKNDKTRLGELLSVCNILSHEVGRNPQEIHKSAKFLMRIIKESDKMHYDAMTHEDMHSD